jgi:hypothetical protein
MKHARENKNEMTKSMRLLPIFLVAVITLTLGICAPEIWAGGKHHDDEIPFSEAKLFFELNNTDGDLGLHALVDGDAWKRLKIEDPKGRKMLDIKVKGRLGRQGLTEIFFESAEPTFDELSPREFFNRFPEGEYEIEGKTLDGEELESEVELTHVMPAPPAPTVNEESMAVQCDEDEHGYDATEVSAPVTIVWPEVTMSHPDPDGGGAGIQPPVPVTIVNYEVVLEVEVNEEFASVFSIILPPDVTSITIPEEFIALGDEFKYEVLAREQSHNQTAVESCFVVVEDGRDDDDDD